VELATLLHFTPSPVKWKPAKEGIHIFIYACMGVSTLLHLFTHSYTLSFLLSPFFPFAHMDGWTYRYMHVDADEKS
jgi:hypothetical protein